MKRVLVYILLIVSMLALAYPITVVDDLGRVVTIEKAPQRVVSVSPAATKYLVYLGLQDRVVGVTDWDMLAGKVEKIGNMVPLNVEKILSLKPDLVLAFGGFQASEIPKLEKVGLKVVAINPRSLNDILKSLVMVGYIFGVEDEAKKKADSLKSKMLSIAKEAYKIPLEKRPKVLYLSSVPQAGSKEIWTACSGSYMNDLITLAGGRNIAASLAGPNGWIPLSIEYIYKEDPDVIIVAKYFGSDEDAKKAVENFKAFKPLKAVRNGKILVIDGNVASQPSPQIFDLLEVIYKFIKE